MYYYIIYDMKIKKYIAKNITEGKRKIKEELGSEAVILSSRKVVKPSGEELIEIVAAIDSNYVQKTPEPKEIKKEQMISKILKKNPVQSSNRITDDNVRKILKEFDALKKNMLEINDNVKYKYAATLGPIFGKLYKILRKQEIPEDIALKLIGSLNDSGMVNNLNSAIEQVKFSLRDYIKINLPLKKSHNTQKVFIFGGTGTGKTTALVRIGIISKLVLKAEVMLISADTYKVGGAEQLETYASISGIQYRSAYNSEEILQICDSESNKDFIMIDSTGRSHKEEDFIDELKEIINVVNPDHRFMVISATTGEETLREQLEKFKVFEPTGIILTKLDEAYSVGSILRVIKDYPLTYITTGQKIPEDLEPASKDMIIKYIIPDNILEKINIK